MNIIKYAIIFLCFNLLIGCNYKHSNPFDPQYDGDKTKIISISSYKILEYGTGFDSNPVNLSRGKFNLVVSLKNTGKALAKNVSGDFILNANANYIQVRKSWDRLFWGEIPPPPFDNIAIGSGYEQTLEITVSSDAPYGYQFELMLKLTDEENQTWTDTISLQIQTSSSVFVIDHITVTEYNQTSTSITYNLDVFLKNISSKQRQINCDISSTDTNITITDGSNKYYVLNPNEVGKNDFPYRFELPKSISRPYSTTFKLTSKDSYENSWENDISVTIN